MNVFELIKHSSDVISTVNGENSLFEAKQLTSSALNIPLDQMVFHYSDEVSQSQYEELSLLVERRISGEPLQYIIGSWEFYSLPFKVGKGVLIPRPETELLCDKAIELINGKMSKNNLFAADLCAGSGCISIVLDRYIEDISIDAYEKYDEAVSFLNDNIFINHAKQVNVLQSDIFTCDVPFEKYDILLSNPPYIPVSDKNTLQNELSFEPETALFAGDGYDFYRCISERWISSIKPGGDIVLEIGIDQADTVISLFKDYFENITSQRDLSGVQRVIIGTHRL